MNHLVLAPILIPLAGGVLVLLGRRTGLAWQRWVGLAATVSLLPVAIALVGQAAGGVQLVYAMGAWPAPFGIVFVLDRLAAWMLLVTAVVAIAAHIHAIGRTDLEGRHFHALLQFQLLGINGAFLTGDLFNLFVFFEVLLIASYALLSHGSRRERTTAAIQVVVLNLLGSTLFLFAVGCIYAAAGTLNFADLAARGTELPVDRLGLWQAGGYMLMVVFALKAALVPLGFWLPSAYGVADGAIAALFSVLTKVGIVAILRVGTLVFPDLDLPAVIWPLALVTLVLGAVGMLAARHLAVLTANAVVVSVGMLLVAVSLDTPASLAAAGYYLAHGTLATAALFLAGDRIAFARGEMGDRLVPGPTIRDRLELPAAFLVAALAVAGLPPLGGFLGKLAILSAAVPAPHAGWALAVVLGASLAAILALSRAGSILLWKPGAGLATTVEPVRRLPWLGTTILVAALAALAVFAGPAFHYAEGLAAELGQSRGYIDTVLGPQPAEELR